MKKSDFFSLVDRHVTPLVRAAGWTLVGPEGLFVRDDADIIMSFQVQGRFLALTSPDQPLTLRASIFLTSRTINNANLSLVGEKPVKSAGKHARMAFGFRFKFPKADVETAEAVWEVAGTQLADRATARADEIRQIYGSINAIKHFFEDVYEREGKNGFVEPLMCIRMLQGDYQGALQIIHEARPKVLTLDQDRSIWGYAARYANAALTQRH
jgi:hypothetical protein